MRKSIKPHQDRKHESPVEEDHWLDLDGIAQVEATSEEWENAIETALVDGLGEGWRAAYPGEQTISLRFDEPIRIEHISVKFSETQTARTQDFVLQWSSDQGKTFHEIVRQQFNFSPQGATEEIENYKVALEGVTVLELVIRPDVSGGSAVASLDRLRVAGSISR